MLLFKAYSNHPDTWNVSYASYSRNNVKDGLHLQAVIVSLVQAFTQFTDNFHLQKATYWSCFA